MIGVSSSSEAQELPTYPGNFADEAWRPEMFVRGAGSYDLGGTCVRFPFAILAGARVSADLCFEFPSGMVVRSYQPFYSELINTDFVLDLDAAEVVIPLIYRNTDPLEALCNTTITRQSNGTYDYVLGDCTGDVEIPIWPLIGAVEWIEAPEGVTRERNTAFVTVGPDTTGLGSGGEWLLAEPGDTLAVAP